MQVPVGLVGYQEEAWQSMQVNMRYFQECEASNKEIPAEKLEEFFKISKRICRSHPELKKLYATYTQVLDKIAATQPWAPQLTPAQSTEAKLASDLVADYVKRFIAFYSQPQQTFQPPLSTVALSGEETKRIQQEFATCNKVMTLFKRNRAGPFYKIAKRRAYGPLVGHAAFKEYVFKKIPERDSLSQVRMNSSAGSCIRLENLFMLDVSPATAFSIPGDADCMVYVEKKIPGLLSQSLQVEFWLRIMKHYFSPDASSIFKNNLKELVRQLDLLIDKTGYWDLEHNYPRVSEDCERVYLLDFESFSSRSCGAIRPGASGSKITLRKIFAHSDLVWCDREMEYCLKINIETLTLYDERGWKGPEPIPPLNCEGMGQKQTELATHIYQKIASDYESKNPEKLSVTQRNFSIYEEWLPREYTWQDIEELLECLVLNGTIVAFKSSFGSYNISY